MRKKTTTLLALLALLLTWMPCQAGTDKIVVAYVASWTTGRLPDPTLMTHINYAFGHVKKTFDGVDIQNPDFLKEVVALKQQNPKLKVVLSVGGWTSGNFSEMAASAQYRRAFAKDCRRVVDQYGLDGIDIDWEYPTSSVAGISSSPDDTDNYTLLMRDLRKALGKKKLLTAATVADARYIDFNSCLRYMDFVNIMAYDVANPPKHHTTLFRSPLSGRITVQEAVEAHVKAGVPVEKLTLGMPLYGRGDHDNKVLDQYVKTRNAKGLYTEQWDSVGLVPYLTDRSGQLVWGFDNAESLAAKCQFILDRGLLGGMYWECTEDNAQLDGMQTIYLSLMKNGKGTPAPRRMLVMTDGTDSDDTRMGVKWLTDTGRKMNVEVTEMTPDESYEKGCLDHYHLIYMLNANPYDWSEACKREFERYIDEGHGSYYCMPHEKKGGWDWYDDFFDKATINPVAGSVFYAGGEYIPQYWTNTAKTSRNIFYQGNDKLSHLPMGPFLKMEKEALGWLLNGR